MKSERSIILDDYYGETNNIYLNISQQCGTN